MALVMAAALLSGCAGAQKNENAGAQNEVVKIATKNYTEQRLTGQMLSVYIEENSDYDTTVTEFGGTMLCYEALKSGQMDLYAEFTGTAYGAILQQTETLGVQETYDYVKKACEERDGITWLKPLGWNNTYVLSVRKETAEELGIKTISDLVPHAKDMVLGGDNEFMARQDGLLGLKEMYGIEFKSEMPMDQGLTYEALRNGDLDVNSSFSTDGRIAKYNLYNLEDDKQFFPPYYVTPILRMDYADAHPDLVELLNNLGDQFTDEELQQLNLRVDEGEDAREVATEALKQKGLI
jgi:glycine betaine/choline ABC-type transport system substrate-binding protein